MTNLLIQQKQKGKLKIQLIDYKLRESLIVLFNQLT